MAASVNVEEGGAPGGRVSSHQREDSLDNEARKKVIDKIIREHMDGLIEASFPQYITIPDFFRPIVAHCKDVVSLRLNLSTFDQSQAKNFLFLHASLPHHHSCLLRLTIQVETGALVSCQYRGRKGNQARFQFGRGGELEKGIGWLEAHAITVVDKLLCELGYEDEHQKELS